MLTPAFELKQDVTFLTVIIKAPFAKISETEIFIEENDFKFYSSPYYLRLTLPGNIVEDSREKADYEASTGVFTIRVPKETPGEHFEGLDMITKLLAPKGQRTAAPPLIQVIDEEFTEDTQQVISNGSTGDGNEAEEVQEEEFDWSIEQTPYTEQASPLDSPRYGFANQKSGVFQRLQEELCGIVDVPDPDKLSANERRELRIQAENEKFDEDHYVADLYDDEIIQSLLQYITPWSEQLKTIDLGASVDETVIFTDEEREKMRNLPRKDYLLDEKEETTTFLGLVDLMLAYCYNHRTTEGENNVESGWTVSKLSATLSWLEVYSCIQDAVVTSLHRSLCFPLYRHWQLSMKVLEDVKQIFKLGRKQLLKCMLEVHSLLIDTESRYILNDLYITDYCVWIQSASELKMRSLADTLSKLTIRKADLRFNLEEIERVAASLYEEENVEHITENIEKLTVTQKQGTNNVSSKKGGKIEVIDSDDTSSDDVETDESTEADSDASSDYSSDEIDDTTVNVRNCTANIGDELVLNTVDKLVSNTDDKLVFNTVDKVVSNTDDKLVPNTVDKLVLNTDDKLVLNTVDKLASNTEDKLVLNTVDKLVSNTEDKLVLNTVDKLASNTEDKLVLNTVDKLVSNTEDKLVLNTVDKLVSNTDVKLVPNTVDKLVSNTDDKLVSNTVDKVVSNSDDKPVLNTVDKLVSNTDDKLALNTVDKLVSNSDDKLVPNTVDKLVPNTVDKLVSNTGDKLVSNTGDELESNSSNDIERKDSGVCTCTDETSKAIESDIHASNISERGNEFKKKNNLVEENDKKNGCSDVT